MPCPPGHPLCLCTYGKAPLELPRRLLGVPAAADLQVGRRVPLPSTSRPGPIRRPWGPSQGAAVKSGRDGASYAAVWPGDSPSPRSSSRGLICGDEESTGQPPGMKRPDQPVLLFSSSRGRDRGDGVGVQRALPETPTALSTRDPTATSGSSWTPETRREWRGGGQCGKCGPGAGGRASSLVGSVCGDTQRRPRPHLRT